MPPPRTIKYSNVGISYAKNARNKSSGRRPQHLQNPLDLDLDHLDVGITTSSHDHYVGRVIQKNSFHSSNMSTIATQSFSTNSSVDNIEQHPCGVTFRDKKRVPKSVHASLSKSSSTLSRKEESCWSPGNSVCTTTHNSIGGISTNQDVLFHAALKLNSLMMNCRLSFHPTELNYLHGKHDIQDTNREECDNLATSEMFSSSDIDAITPLQITNYLTMEERETIGAQVLCSKLEEGYKLARSANDACETCYMPRLSISSKLVEKCDICPVLKKRVLGRILGGCY